VLAERSAVDRAERLVRERDCGKKIGFRRIDTRPTAEAPYGVVAATARDKFHPGIPNINALSDRELIVWSDTL
jgi:hypothetical protein